MNLARQVPGPDPTDHVRGASHAPIVLIEYGDFECPYCKQAAGTVKALVHVRADSVCLVFRHFPLEDVHPHALLAAEAAEAAGAQGRFWEMHDLLLAHQSHLDRPRLRAYAEQLELDIPDFVDAIEDELYRQRVREHLEQGRRSGVHATPTFFVNGVLHDVSFGLDRLYEAVNVLAKRR